VRSKGERNNVDMVLLGIVFVVGGIGGLVSSLINDKGFLLPQTIARGDSACIFLPGFVGSMLIGTAAASVSWLLYGPLSQLPLGTGAGTPSMVLATLGDAVLVGMVGSAMFSKRNSANQHR
jgi:hypothetical protein